MTGAPPSAPPPPPHSSPDAPINPSIAGNQFFIVVGMWKKHGVLFKVLTFFVCDNGYT
jgi:hypothetical protein